MAKAEADALGWRCSIKQALLKILQNTLAQQFFGEFHKIFTNTNSVEYMWTPASENWSIKSNSTVRSLSKLWFFCVV